MGFIDWMLGRTPEQRAIREAGAEGRVVIIGPETRRLLLRAREADGLTLGSSDQSIQAALKLRLKEEPRTVDVSNLQAVATDGNKLVLYFEDQWHRDAFWDSLDVKDAG